jgi:transcriptional regulator with XRE-family HTH domain
MFEHSVANPAQGQDFRAFLRSELAARCAKNPRYSLRAFAKRLGTDHSTLSQILRGQRAMAVRTIERCCTGLGLSAEQCRAFIVAERGRRRESPDGHRQVRRLGRDVSVLLSDWRHFAILELTRLESFRNDSRWIARVLGSTVDEVNVAVQRLLRFGLLLMTDAGHWTTSAPSTPITFGDFVDAISSQLPARLLRADTGNAWDLRPRDRSVTTLAVDSRRVDAAIEIMERCRAEVTKLLATGTDKDDVYRLEISLTPVTITRP